MGTMNAPARTKRNVYRVLPVDGMWRIELAGDSVSEVAESRADAIARARVLARRTPPGSVVVLDATGRVDQEIELDAI